MSKWIEYWSYTICTIVPNIHNVHNMHILHISTLSYLIIQSFSFSILLIMNIYIKQCQSFFSLLFIDLSFIMDTKGYSHGLRDKRKEKRAFLYPLVCMTLIKNNSCLFNSVGKSTWSKNPKIQNF